VWQEELRKALSIEGRSEWESMLPTKIFFLAEGVGGGGGTGV
jgi:hypothetical protein